ncbi:hypothetical protein V500_01181 [Pseudogymnoascus sp. VKM F-4518 (FW-2643)]|nr:hypothetical protein V500_01181 [Pseudogymnoascus sp. VKM F-4518 (FW-2643)]
MINSLRHHWCLPPLPDMAAASALDLVVLEVLELRPLGQERLAARVTQSAAVVAEWALVAEAAGGPAVLDGRCGGDGARSVIVAKLQAILLLVPKAPMEIKHQLRRARWRRWRYRYDWWCRPRGGRVLAIIQVDAVLASALLARVACTRHIALLISIGRGNTSRRQGIRTPALLAVLCAGEAEAEGDTGGSARLVGLVCVAALDGGLQRAAGGGIRVAPKRLAVIDIRRCRDSRGAVPEIEILLATAGLRGVARAGECALGSVDDGRGDVVKDVAAPALEAVFEAGVLEAGGEAGGAAGLGGLGVLGDLGVECQDARREADGVGVAAEVDAGGCCGGGDCGGGSGFLGRGGGAGRFCVAAAIVTTTTTTTTAAAVVSSTEAEETTYASDDASDEATEAELDAHAYSHSRIAVTGICVCVCIGARFRVG